MEKNDKSIFDNGLNKNLIENKELDNLFEEYNNKNEDNKIDIVKIQNEIKLILNKYKNSNKGIVDFPRLKNTIAPFIQINNQILDINDYYKIYLLLFNDEEIFCETKKYYYSIIKNNNYGIDDLFKNKTLIDPEIIDDYSYKDLITTLSIWYSLNEMFILSLYYLLEYFKIDFKYDIYQLNNLSVDLEKKINLFSSDNAYKWASFIMKYSKKNIQSNITNLFSFFKNFFNQGIFFIGKIALDNIVVNFLDKTSSSINIQNIRNELEKYTKYIKILNYELENVNDDINSLLKHEIKNYIQNKLNNNSSELDDSIKREKLIKRVQNYFDGYIDIEKLNYEVVNNSINETELNNGWTEMNFNKYDE